MKRMLARLPLLFLFLPLALRAEADLGAYLSEDAWGVIEIENAESLSEDFRNGPLGRLWTEEVEAKLIGWWEEKLASEEDEQARETVRELLDRLEDLSGKFKGGIAFSIGGDLADVLEALADGDEADAIPEILFLAETEANEEDLADFIEWVEEKARESARKEGDEPDLRVEKEEVVGETVFFLGPRERDDEEHCFGLAIVDGVLCAGVGRSPSIAAVEGLADEPGGGLAENPDYEDVFEEIGRGDLRLFVNFRVLGPLFAFLKESETTQIPENPFGVTTAGLLDALALDGLECLALQIDLSEEGLEVGSALYLGERTGLLALLESAEGAPPMPPFVPAGAFTATTVRYDLGRLWPKLEKVLKEVSPALSLMVDGQIKAFETKAGVNVRKDLLGSLGDEIVTFSEMAFTRGNDFADALKNYEEGEGAPEEPPVREVYAIGLRDGRALDRSIRGIVDAFAGGAKLFDERRHRGVTIRTMKGAGGDGPFFSYAITPEWLLLSVGKASGLNQVVNRLHKARSTLWKRPDVAAALREAPPGVSQWDYVDLSSLTDFLLPLLDMVVEEETGEPFFGENLPKLPYFMLGWTRDAKRGFTSRLRTYPKEK